MSRQTASPTNLASMRGMANFFGVADYSATELLEKQQKWRERARAMHAKNEKVQKITEVITEKVSKLKPVTDVSEQSHPPRAMMVAAEHVTSSSSNDQISAPLASKESLDHYRLNIIRESYDEEEGMKAMSLDGYHGGGPFELKREMNFVDDDADDGRINSASGETPQLMSLYGHAESSRVGAPPQLARLFSVGVDEVDGVCSRALVQPARRAREEYRRMGDELDFGVKIKKQPQSEGTEPAFSGLQLRYKTVTSGEPRKDSVFDIAREQLVKKRRRPKAKTAMRSILPADYQVPVQPKPLDEVDEKESLSFTDTIDASSPKALEMLHEYDPNYPNTMTFFDEFLPTCGASYRPEPTNVVWQKPEQSSITATSGIQGKVLHLYLPVKGELNSPTLKDLDSPSVYFSSLTEETFSDETDANDCVDFSPFSHPMAPYKKFSEQPSQISSAAPKGVSRNLKESMTSALGRKWPASEPDTSRTPLISPSQTDVADSGRVKGSLSIPQESRDYLFNNLQAERNEEPNRFAKCCLGCLGCGSFLTQKNTQMRVYFTYWVTTVQVVCFIVAAAVYGIGPIGFTRTTISEKVMTTSLTKELVDRVEVDNMWIGPRQADLIHMGARYTLCMRRDVNLERQTMLDQRSENKTACCVRNDGSGAVQTSESKCSPRLSTWLKWNGTDNQLSRQSGSVCGQDPRFCSKPPLSLRWQDDITKWPICTDSVKAPSKQEFRHMLYDVIGRPCCIGIQGQCVIVTREHCTFLRGYFHEEASLCSQVMCLEEICGMIPFLDSTKPNQFYRIWISLFLHAGVIELVISVVIQLFYIRYLEMFAGWHRTAIIYMFSGMGGSLGSALFVPYHVETGPSAAQFGMLACSFVDLYRRRHDHEIRRDLVYTLAKLIAIFLVGLIVGFLPLVDNWANMFGFIFGLLFSLSLLPYDDQETNYEKLIEEEDFEALSRQIRKNNFRKKIRICLCLGACFMLFSGFFIIFYLAPIYSCEHCQYFNCLPFTDTFCDQAEVLILRTDL